MQSLPNGAVRVTRSELFRIVDSTTTFTLWQNQINPGLPNIFPWLSQIASSFEQYRWNHLCFSFRSTASDNTNTANTALGVVLTGVSYDSYDPSFTSRVEMSNYTGVKRCRPCDDLDYLTNLSSTATRNMFVRTGPVPADADRRLYDIGTFNFATDAAQNANPVGELWVSYSIDLIKPKLNPEGAAKTSTIVISGADATVPFGSTQTVSSDEIGVTVTPTAIAFPPQSALPSTYRIYIYWLGTPAAITYPLYTGSNCTITQNVTGPEGGVTAGQAFQTLQVNVTDPSVTAIVNAGVAGTLPANWNGVIRLIDVGP